MEFLQIPYGQSYHHQFRGELDVAQRLSEDLLRLGVARNDTTGLVLGHLSCGRNLGTCGRFAVHGHILKKCLRYMIQFPITRLFIWLECTPT